MAFNGVGSHFLNPGKSIRVGVHWGATDTQGTNQGTELITADPNNDGIAGSLAASNFEKEIGYNEFYANGLGDTRSAYWLYWVTVTNTGSTGKWFSLQGGGVS